MRHCISVLLLIIICCVYSERCLAAMCHGKPDPSAKGNSNPIYTDAPVFVKSVKNGKLFTVGDGEDKINVVHVWGTPYEWGEAQGQLLHDETSTMMNRLWTYLEEQVESGMNKTLHFPMAAQKLIADVGLHSALGLTYEATKKYTGSYFYEELRGLADSTGVEYNKLLQIHMIGELTKGACSMFGAWGSATANGETLQLRSLDWDVEGPFKDYPQITVYHVNDTSLGHDFINIGWSGWVGSITGMSSTQMAISEIGASFPDETFGKESRFGTPFTFLLRDVLQFDETLDDSINRMSNAKRTCNLILGVGDGKLGTFRSVRYSGSNIAFFDDKNMQPLADWHPRMENVVYYGMDWLCPNYSEVLHRELERFRGNLTAENAIHNIIPITQSGNLHIALYDLTNQVFWTSNARASYETGPAMAYDRTFSRLDAAKLFAETRP